MRLIKFLSIAIICLFQFVSCDLLGDLNSITSETSVTFASEGGTKEIVMASENSFTLEMSCADSKFKAFVDASNPVYSSLSVGDDGHTLISTSVHNAFFEVKYEASNGGKVTVIAQPNSTGENQYAIASLKYVNGDKMDIKITLSNVSASE